MEGRCHECGAPLEGKKCDYCGAKSKRVKEQDKPPLNNTQRKVLKEARGDGILSLILSAIEIVVDLFV